MTGCDGLLRMLLRGPHTHVQILSGVCEDDVMFMADVAPHLHYNLYSAIHHHHTTDWESVHHLIRSRTRCWHVQIIHPDIMGCLGGPADVASACEQLH